MWIGASPGSTGGGIKTTTVGVLFLHFINYLRGRDNLHFGHRRIDPLSIQKAQMALFATITVTLILLILLVWLEPKIAFLQLAFEAVATVSISGLTLGITEQLTTASKYIIVIFMYIGRVGVLTFLFAFFVQRKQLLYEYPDEKVIIG
jgi:trk system potassium uptake protein TrkH